MKNKIANLLCKFAILVFYAASRIDELTTWNALVIMYEEVKKVK